MFLPPPQVRARADCAFWFGFSAGHAGDAFEQHCSDSLADSGDSGGLDEDVRIQVQMRLNSLIQAIAIVRII